MLTIPYTSVTSIGIITIDTEKNPKKLDNAITIDNNDITLFEQELTIQDKNDREKSINKLQIIINLIKIIFNDNPEMVSQCQQSLYILLKLPDIICEQIFWFVIEPLLSILYDIWYNHPDFFVHYYAYFLIHALERLYDSICDWYPYPPINSKSPYHTSTLSELIQSSKIRLCPCIMK